MAKRVPEGPPPAQVVQKVRLRYTKRGRLRFTSHRDFARAFERALRRAQVPMAYSAGFHPHPKISYIGAAPTGVASEAEFVEIGLQCQVEVETLRKALDQALPDGIDVIEAVAVAAEGAGSLAERMQASQWRVELPGVDPHELEKALEAFLIQPEWPVERLTKDGKRTLDARGPVVRAEAEGTTLNLIVRITVPTVRPDDVLTALASVGGLTYPAVPVASRLAQGPLDGTSVLDPLAADRG